MSKERKAKSRRTGHKANNKIDITGIFTKPVKVGKNGRQQSMTPFEVSLRAQAKKAIKERSLPAINAIMALVIEYGLVEPPPEFQNGGVKLMPLELTMEDYKRYQVAKAKGLIKADERIENAKIMKGS